MSFYHRIRVVKNAWKNPILAFYFLWNNWMLKVLCIHSHFIIFFFFYFCTIYFHKNIQLENIYLLIKKKVISGNNMLRSHFYNYLVLSFMIKVTAIVSTKNCMTKYFSSSLSLHLIFVTLFPLALPELVTNCQWCLVWPVIC